MRVEAVLLGLAEDERRPAAVEYSREFERKAAGYWWKSGGLLVNSREN